MKKLHFISGLPRSGSTLLCNILAQNPRFHVTSTNGLSEVFGMVKNSWQNITEFKATPNESAKNNVLKGILDGFYESIDKPVVFDKSRAWPKLIPSVEKVTGEKVKILATVRDIREILSSWEKLYRKTSEGGQWIPEINFPVEHQTVQSRAQFAMKDTQVVGSAYNRLKDAGQRGLADRIFLIDFQDLTTEPEKTMQAVYNFLEEPYFPHDFTNVEQVTQEDDAVYNIKDLHTIRSKVEPLKPDWKEVLGEWADDYKKFNFWK